MSTRWSEGTERVLYMPSVSNFRFCVREIVLNLAQICGRASLVLLQLRYEEKVTNMVYEGSGPRAVLE